MTPEQATELLNKCKQDYPSPVTCFDTAAQQGGACVGGIFCQIAGTLNKFPVNSALANVLKRYNKKLDANVAYAFACSITEHNDHGYFDIAWQKLYEALTFGENRD